MLKYNKSSLDRAAPFIYLVIALFALVTLILTGCKKPEQRLGKVTIHTQLMVDGILRVASAERAGIGEITGGGAYLHGSRVVINAHTYPYSEYHLVALYEKEGKGGFTRERGLVNETSLTEGYKKVKDQLCTITLTVGEDMTFVAEFSKGKGGKDDPETPDTPKEKETSIEISGVQITETMNNPDTISVISVEYK